MIGAFIFLVVVGSLIYMMIGGSFVEMLYKNYRRLSPIYKPFIFLTWPLALVMLIFVGVYEWFVGWIEECKDYYQKDMEEGN